MSEEFAEQTAKSNSNSGFSLTREQEKLREKHGTPEEFEEAVIRAIPEISLTEAIQAIHKYREEWSEAGLVNESEGGNGK